MNAIVRLAAALFAAALAAGCATTPPTNVHQPMSARPAPAKPPVQANGAIYQADGNQRSLFEDRRARYVGDTLIISLNERNVATKKSNTKADRTTSTTATVDTIAGLPGKSAQGLSVSGSSDISLDGSGESASNNAFTGTITVTVIETLGNGNLLVSGEKQLTLNQGTEFIRFSGVVNPANISATNTVSSVQVADARMEYRQNGFIDQAQVMGWLARFFLSVLPL